MNLTPGPQPDDVIRRLRAWPVSSWTPERRSAARDTMQRLVSLSSAPAVPLPDLDPTSYPDQLAVLYREASAHPRSAGRSHTAGAGESGTAGEPGRPGADRLLADLAARLGWR